MFYLSKAAVPHLKSGSAIVNTASINSKSPSLQLLAYATTKGAIANFTAGPAQPPPGERDPRNPAPPRPTLAPPVPPPPPPHTRPTSRPNHPPHPPPHPAPP